MPQFRYRAVTPTGEFVAGEVEAPSQQEVLRRIEYLGHMAIEAEPAAAGMLARQGGFFAVTANAREVTAFLSAPWIDRPLVESEETRSMAT